MSPSWYILEYPALHTHRDSNGPSTHTELSTHVREEPRWNKKSGYAIDIQI